MFRAFNDKGPNANQNANHVAYDEYTGTVRRMDRMEYSVGNVVARVK
jgi:hypothetical protein